MNKKLDSVHRNKKFRYLLIIDSCEILIKYSCNYFY